MNICEVNINLQEIVLEARTFFENELILHRQFANSCFQDQTLLRNRNSRPEVFCEKGVLRNFIKFTEIHINFIKKEILVQVFFCEFCKISKNTFSYRTPLVAASVGSEN